jgi:hypothetical protein
MKRIGCILAFAIYFLSPPVAGGDARQSSRITPVQRFQLLKGACASGDERAVEILLECGADPNGGEDWKTEEIGGRYGDEFSSPMTAAAMAGHIGTIKLLLRHGAVVDLMEGEGNTPLSMAIYAKKKKSVAFLLSAGADPTKRMVAESLARCEDAEIKALVSEAISKKNAQPGGTDNSGAAPLRV